MEEIAGILDKLLQLGHDFGLPGLLLAVVGYIVPKSAPHITKAWVENKKNARAHELELTKWRDRVKRRRAKRKGDGNNG